MLQLPHDIFSKVILFMEISSIINLGKTNRKIRKTIKKYVICTVCKNTKKIIGMIGEKYICSNCPSGICQICNTIDFPDNLFKGIACHNFMDCCTRYEHKPGKCYPIKCDKCGLKTKIGRYMFRHYACEQMILCIKCAKIDIFCGLNVSIKEGYIVKCEFAKQTNIFQEDMLFVYPYGKWDGIFIEDNIRQETYTAHNYIYYIDNI